MKEKETLHPFFERFLETSLMDELANVRAGQQQTHPGADDSQVNAVMDKDVTHKYPSDHDEEDVTED